MTNLNDLAADCHQIAVDHGWWETKRTFPEQIALMHSELSEALEAWRDETATNHVYYLDGKPEGIASELADTIIRILDTCGRFGIDIERVLKEKMDYNRTRPYRHGGKRA